MLSYYEAMKILHSVPHFFPYSYGGGQVYVQAVAKELSGRGHEVYILSSKPWEGQDGTYKLNTYEYDKLKVIAIEVNPGTTCLLDVHAQVGPTLMAALQAAVQKARPEIVHLSGFKPALTRICKELGIPFVVTAHHPGFVCPAGALLTKQESLCETPTSDKVCIRCCIRQRVKTTSFGSLLCAIPDKILFPFGRLVGNLKQAPYLLRGLAYPWFIHESIMSKNFVLRNASVIIAPSRAIAKYLILNGIPQSKINIIPHGIDPLGKLPIRNLEGRPIRFGYMGTFSRPKGFHVLVQALQFMVPEKLCELHVYGEARHPWEKDYLNETMNDYHGFPVVIFHGRIDHDKLREAYQAIDVLVVPSIYLEVFGLVVLEALSAGIPVIVSKSGGPEEIVRHGVDGFVVERNDSRALAEAMQKFIENPALVIEMSNKIPPVKTIQEHVDEVEKIYHRLIPSKN